MEVIEEQHTKISKDMLKEKYIDLLENDPYYKANNQARNLIGEQADLTKITQKVDGISWGISD